jgi:hypothetical protein
VSHISTTNAAEYAGNGYPLSSLSSVDSGIHFKDRVTIARKKICLVLIKASRILIPN